MPSEDREIIRKFTRRLTVSIDYHRELLRAVELKTHQASLETMLAEQFTFNSAVLWEVFLSDLLLAYLVRSPRVYLSSLKDRVSTSLKDRFGSELEKSTAVHIPIPITRARARALVDPKNFNITVQSASALATKANSLLAATHARKFTLNQEDARLVDFVICIRNYLGHRSDAARVALKSSIAPLIGVNADLNGPMQNVGAYLKQRNAAGDTRAIFIAQRIVQVAGLL